MNPAERTKWIQLVVLPILFYLGAKLSLAFAVLPEVTVMLWMPNSLLVAALLHYGFRRYSYFAALIVLAEIAADYPTFSWIEAVMFGAINVGEATVAYALLRYWRFDAQLAAPIDLAKFVLAGPVIAAMLAALAAAAVYATFRHIDSYFEMARVWWFSDGLGLLILTPLVLSVWPPAAGEPHERIVLRWYDYVAIVPAAAAVIIFVAADQGLFRGVPVRTVLLLPLVLYVAARFSLRATTVVLVGVVSIVMYSAKTGRQPFGPLSMQQTLLLVQELVFIMSVMSLGLAALLRQLRANTRELERRVQERTAELTAANSQLQTLAVTDWLTGLPNRRALFDLLQREINRERRQGHTLAVIMFDIDYFKDVNDRYGHVVGDSVLRHVAVVTGGVTRNMDVMARYGGEEFVLIAPDTGLAEATALAERMRAALAASEMRINEHVLRVTASFGVATLQPEDREPDRLLHRADAALYAAKAAGRNRVIADAPP